ncbi:hypothetical protein ABIE56_003705 [Luteibacter sp. 621]|uniref:hypothetical protein n=1 Tax=Luteibacter sp. 621 TaxID=3373916 RepID=UPI003D1E4260
MNVIAEKSWSFVLFDDGEGWVMTVLIGGVVEVDVCVRLSNSEMEWIRADLARAETLAEGVKSNRANFAEREIRPPVWPPKN